MQWITFFKTLKLQISALLIVARFAVGAKHVVAGAIAGAGAGAVFLNGAGCWDKRCRNNSETLGN